MNEPTQEQIKRFWEHWGFTEKFGEEWRYEEFKTTNHWWEAPSGRKYKELPPIDLNNPFRYAVPKLDWNSKAVILNEWVTDILDDKDPALALFWAIYKLIDKADIPLRINESNN